MASQKPTRRVAPTPHHNGSRPLVADVTGERKEPNTDVLKLIMTVIVVVLALAVFAVGGLLVLRSTSAFEINRLEAASTEHLSSDDIARLANIGSGTTLLTLNDASVREGLSRNPWVQSVDIDREFPDTLRLVVHERPVSMIVLMASNGIAWYVGEGNVWIQPASITPAGGRSLAEEALSMAQEQGALLVTDASTSIEPESGANVADDALEAVSAYLEELPSGLTEQIVSFSAASPESLSCVLANGIEVSLGSASDIAAKGSIVLQLIAEHPGELTYINVRTPSSPSYRSISLSTVQPGTGTSAEGEVAEGTLG